MTLNDVRRRLSTLRHSLLELDGECRGQWVDSTFGHISKQAPDCAEHVIGSIVDAGQALDDALKRLTQE